MGYSTRETFLLPHSLPYEIKTKPNKNIITISNANITDIILNIPVPPATSHRAIAIKDKRIPIPIRIIPNIFRIGLGINSNNKSTITTFPNC